jgi:hypothetical protein
MMRKLSRAWIRSYASNTLPIVCSFMFVQLHYIFGKELLNPLLVLGKQTHTLVDLLGCLPNAVERLVETVSTAHK